MASYHSEHSLLPGVHPRHRSARSADAIVKAQCRDNARENKNKKNGKAWERKKAWHSKWW